MKVATIATEHPERYAAGVEVLLEDAQVVGEMLNWTAGEHPVVHVSLACGDDGWGGGLELQTLRLLGGPGAWTTRLGPFVIVIDKDTQVLRLGVRCYVAPGETLDVQITVGAAAAATFVTFTDADNGTEQELTVATADTGVGDQLVTLEVKGGTTACFIRNMRIEDAPIAAADLPDPADA